VRQIAFCLIEALPDRNQESSSSLFTKNDETRIQEVVEIADVNILASRKLSFDCFVEFRHVSFCNAALNQKKEFADRALTNLRQFLLDRSKRELSILYPRLPL
jgi:hypothetical protein